MWIDKRVVVVAAILVACKSKPRLKGRRLVIWRDVRRILDKYDIKYKAYECMFTYSRGFSRKHEDTWTVQRADGYRREFVEYTRYKTVITDYDVAKEAVELLDNPESKGSLRKTRRHRARGLPKPTLNIDESTQLLLP